MIDAGRFAVFGASRGMHHAAPRRGGRALGDLRYGLEPLQH